MLLIPAELAHLPDAQIAAKLNVSRTAVLYAKRRRDGKCERCGKTPIEGSRFCGKHTKKLRAYHRKRRGHKAWKPGGRGRPPLTFQKEKAA